MSEPLDPHTVVISRRRRGRKEPRVDLKDFRQPARPRGESQKAVLLLSQRFAFAMSQGLANYLRVPVESDAGPVEMLEYQEAVERLPERSWWLPLTSEDGERAVLLLDHALQWNMINLLLGSEPKSKPEAEGEAGATPPPVDVDRMGPISRAALKTFVASLLREVNGIFRANVDPFVIDEERRGEIRAKMLRARERVARFSSTLREGSRQVAVDLLVREAALEPLLRDAGPDANAVKAAPRAVPLEGLVRTLAVAFSARLGNAFVGMRELVSLKPGEVLVLDRRVGEPLELLVGTKVKFLGQPGRSSGRNAVRIIERIRDEVSE